MEGWLWFAVMGAILFAAYSLVKSEMYVHDLERAVNSSPDAKAYMKNLDDKRREAQAATLVGAGRCPKCTWFLATVLDDKGIAERKCINEMCEDGRQTKG